MHNSMLMTGAESFLKNTIPGGGKGAEPKTYLYLLICFKFLGHISSIYLQPFLKPSSKWIYHSSGP